MIQALVIIIGHKKIFFLSVSIAPDKGRNQTMTLIIFAQKHKFVGTISIVWVRQFKQVPTVYV